MNKPPKRIVTKSMVFIPPAGLACGAGGGGAAIAGMAGGGGIA